MRRILRTIVILSALVLVAGSCSDDTGGEPSGDGIDIEDPAPQDPGETDGDEGDGDASGTADGESGDLKSIWPLPDGEAMVLFAWSQIDDEFQLSENADFTMTGTGASSVLDFYRGYFPTIGLEMAEFPAGGSTVMNLIKPDDQFWSGVMQTTDNADGTTTVHQQFSRLKLEDDPEATTSTVGAVSSDAESSSD